MKKIKVLSAAWLTVASLSFAAASAGDIQPFLIGEMAKVELLETPVSLVTHEIIYADGTKHALGEKKGRVLLVNLWQKSCVPCAAEMEDFSKLQKEMGDDRFEIVVLPLERRSTKSLSNSRRLISSTRAATFWLFEKDSCIGIPPRPVR